MANNSSALKKEIESFKLSTMKISDKINSVSNIWNDNNFSSLQTQMSEFK